MDAARQVKANLMMDKHEAEKALKSALLGAQAAYQNLLTEGYVLNSAYPEDEIDEVNMDAMRAHWEAFERSALEAKRLKGKIRDLKRQLGEN